MSPEMTKAMVEAWVKTTIAPLINAGIKSAIPIVDICGVFAGVLVGIAKKAGWTEQQVIDLIKKIWEPAPKDPPAAA